MFSHKDLGILEDNIEIHVIFADYTSNKTGPFCQ